MSSLAKDKDWSDYLSPILIKEFRQGLRSQVFLWAFMLIHVFMAWGLITYLSAGTSVRARTFASAFFWMIVAIPLLPFGAMGSIAQERRDGTLDLIQLAHQNTFKLILGKWMANAGLTLLLVIAILPYLVLRYYLGSVDVISDFRSLSIVLVASFLLGGVAITCSSTAVHAMRQWIAFLILGAVLLSGMTAFLFFFQEAFQRDMDNILFIYAYFLVACAYALYMALKWATTQVAPVSENHGYALRWVHLAFMGLNFLVLLLVDKSELEGVIIALSLVMSIAVHIRVMCEEDAKYIGELNFFKNTNILQKLKIIFFAPGSHTGCFYLLLVWFTVFLLGAATKELDGDKVMEFGVVVLTIYMGLTFSFHLGEIFSFGIGNFLMRSLLWIGILMLPFIFFVVGDALDQSWETVMGKLCQCVPVSSFLYCLYKSMRVGEWGFLFIAATHIVLFIPVAIVSMRSIKPTFALLNRYKAKKKDVAQA